MVILITLFAVFFGAAGALRVATGHWDLILSGNIALCAMLCMAAVGHIIYLRGMQLMLPDFVPFKKEVVILTGLLEVAAGIALLFPATRRLTGLLLIAYFILILPSNIYAAFKHVNLATAAYDGKGPSYLWIRVPEQVLYIFWAWYFSVRPYAGLQETTAE
ncbi:DoxX family protein [Chitinophaga lutea]